MNIKTSLLWLFIFSAVALFPQTSISGGAVSGLWTKANSPYLVTNAIMVANGTTLTLEPGVVVKFQGSFKLLNLGQIIAVGTAADSIIFTASNKTTGWRGIRFDQTSSTNDSSRFVYCRVEFGNVIGLSNGDEFGGAFFLNAFGKVLIANSCIANCKAFEGGAISASGSSIRIANNKFANNSASTDAAIDCSNFGAPAYISNNLFTNNTSTASTSSYGGAIGVWDNSEIYGNTFINNVSLATDYSGGAIYCGSTCAAKIYNNKFFGNSSPNWCGGAIFTYEGSPSIYNNLIVNNSALKGGGIHSEEGSAKIYNNTIANNTASLGGAINFKSSNVTVSNTIMWGNFATSGGNQIFLENDASDPNFYYCDIAGGQTAIGMNSNIFYLGNFSNNITANPNFITPSAVAGSTGSYANTNWSLYGSSSCVDAGDPAGTYPAYDITFGPRIIGGRIDIGAYENSPTNGFNELNITQLPKIYPNPSSGNFTVYLQPQIFNRIEVYRTDGQKVFSEMVQPQQESLNINLSELTPGIYILKSDRSEAQKIILQK